MRLPPASTIPSLVLPSSEVTTSSLLPSSTRTTPALMLSNDDMSDTSNSGSDCNSGTSTSTFAATASTRKKEKNTHRKTKATVLATKRDCNINSDDTIKSIGNHGNKDGIVVQAKTINNKNKNNNKNQLEMDVHIHHAEQLLDKGNTKLQKELDKLVREYKTGKQELRKELDGLLVEHQRKKKAAQKKKQTIKDLNEKKQLLQKCRTTNMELRRAIECMEMERDALQYNIQTMTVTNEKARRSISDAKTEYMKSLIRHNQLVRDNGNVTEEIATHHFNCTSHSKILDAEEEVRYVYLTAIKRVVQLVQKTIPDKRISKDDKRLKADAARVARLFIATENRRRILSGYPAPCRHDDDENDDGYSWSYMNDSFRSATSATDRCDDDW
jgi:hypothetical protein